MEAYNLSFQATENDVMFVLTGDGSKIDALMKFENRTLRWCALYVQGTPMLRIQQADNYLDMAKNFLARYKLHFNAIYCDELTPLLDRINVLGRNQSVSSGNIVLKVTVQDRRVNFEWHYQMNGLEAPRKKLSVTLESGLLRGFVDHWSIKKIGSTTINISEKEATDIAFKVAKDDIDELGATVTKIEASVDLWNHEATGRGSPNTLYPAWHVILHFDKTYSGFTIGYRVDIWADTGEVYYADSLGYIGPAEPQASWFDANLYTAMMILPAILAIITIMHKKRSSTDRSVS